VDEGGMAHLYTFRPKEEMPDLLATFGGRGFTVTYSAPCGNVAPGISRWVIDLARPL